MSHEKPKPWWNDAIPEERNRICWNAIVVDFEAFQDRHKFIVTGPRQLAIIVKSCMSKLVKKACKTSNRKWRIQHLKGTPYI